MKNSFIVVLAYAGILLAICAIILLTQGCVAIEDCDDAGECDTYYVPLPPPPIYFVMENDGGASDE